MTRPDRSCARSVPSFVRRLPIVLCVLLGLALALRVARAPQATASPHAPPSRLLILVADEALDAVAEDWIGYRRQQGWAVQLVRLSRGSPTSPQDLQATLRGLAGPARESGSPQVSVLLLGDADVIPTFRFPQPDPRLVDRADPEFSSDHPYQLLDDLDELPDLALGRIPVRTPDAARAVLEKIRRYEQGDFVADPAWRHRLTFVAGEGRFGPADAILESLFRTLVDRMVPERFELSMTYASPGSIYCPPPSKLEETIAGRFAEPALWVNYLGHGFAEGLDRMRWGSKHVPMLTKASLERFATPRDSLPIAFFGCCSVGWFDRPEGKPSLAELLLEAPGGPVAIIAGSRPTHPYGTAILQKDLIRGLLNDRVATVGELDLQATRSMLLPDSDDTMIDLLARPIAAVGQWPCSLRDLRLMHVRMYNLLGDPCTRIAHPPAPSGGLRLEGSTLRGTVPGVRTGLAEVLLETVREASAAGPLRPPASPEAADLESIAAVNYPQANARTLWFGRVAVRDERFDMVLPDPLPEGAAILRAVVVGEDAAGGTLEMVEAMRLPAQRSAGG